MSVWLNVLDFAHVIVLLERENSRFILRDDVYLSARLILVCVHPDVGLDAWMNPCQLSANSYFDPLRS